MPGGDGTGPFGAGPRFGRCYGWGRGAGGGFGWRHRYWATGVPGWGRGAGWYGAYPGDPGVPSAEFEREGLRRQAESLELELQQIRRRLDDLSEETSETKK